MWNFSLFIHSMILGIGATIVMDFYAGLLKKFLGISSLDYALLGRWFLHLKTGQIIHSHIIQSQAMKYEKILGWLLHYLIGIVLCLIFIFIVGETWLQHVTFLPAMLFGLSTVILPFFILQPCFGFGIMASRTAQPNIAHIRSLFTHCIFGFGLYLTAYFLSIL